MSLRAMIEQGEIVETIIRAINAGASLLIAGVFLATRRLNWRRALGGLFSLSTAGYVLGSSATISEALGPMVIPVRVLSIYAPVIFWWFALSLFDDDFEWRWPTFVPFALITLFAAGFFTTDERLMIVTTRYAHQMTMMVMYAHAMYVALRYAPDDLIEGRRRFRAIFAIAIAATGIMIAFGEVASLYITPPRALLLFHATAIALLTFAFGLWLIQARRELLDVRLVVALAAPPAGGRPEASNVPPADRPFLERLSRLMADGAWREEGLTVAALAGRVGLAEHNLRRLINGQLGFRNFSAFLNSYRIEEAKAALADPAQARKQVLQIALDLGYGSIAPFNRAFKDATGQTPTEFRKAKLGDA